MQDDVSAKILQDVQGDVQILNGMDSSDKGNLKLPRRLFDVLGNKGRKGRQILNVANLRVRKKLLDLVVLVVRSGVNFDIAK